LSTAAYILFLHGPTWQFARCEAGQVTFTQMMPPEEASTPQNIAKRVAEELHHAGYVGQPCVLALGAGECLAASIETADLPRGDRKAMLYRLEEKVPLAAEHVVADFAGPQTGGRALGVCVREDAIAPLLNSLETCGVAVQSVTPTALLAAQQLAEAQTSQNLLIGEGDQVNIIAVRDGAPLSWSVVPAMADDVQLQLDLVALDVGDDSTLRACGIETEILAGRPVERAKSTERTVAAMAGAAVLAGRRRPWIELRRDALAIEDPLRLHRRGLNALLAMAALFLLALTAGLLWRAHRYDHLAKAAEEKMVEAFSAAFPGASVPEHVRTIVDAEYRKITGRTAGSLPPELSESALRTAYAVLSKIPPDLKLQASNVIFGDSSFTISLKLRAYEDVDKFARAVRDAGFDVPLANAQRGGDGYWSVDVRGERHRRATAPQPPSGTAATD
jgi:type II secretory pathway component PulL